MPNCPTRRGGTIPELLAGAAALALLAALILPAAARFRADSRAASSLSQLRWIAGVTSSYAADNGDQFWTFSWKAGALPHSTPGLPTFASTEIQAAAVQAIEILHRLGGRTDMRVPTAWIAHPLFTHLPLADYIGSAVPNLNLVSPADRRRLAWARDPEAHDQGAFLPYQEPPSEATKRWPYSSSYLAPAAMWDLSDLGSRLSQGGSHRQWLIPSGARLGGAPITQIDFPSQKVVAFDQEQRELGAGGLHCVDPHARAAVMMGDGSAAVRASADSNQGWRPNDPASANPTRYQYQPATWEAPIGPSGPVVTGHYRWTRGGIAGRDFGGPEVDTGQP